MTMRPLVAALAATLLCGPAAAEPAPNEVNEVDSSARTAYASSTDVPPPAAPAPSRAGVGDLAAHLQELAQVRRQVIEAERELRQANAAVARARGSSSREERARARQEEAQAAFDQARSRLPELMVRARAAGLSAAAARRYEHSLYGH